VDAGSVRALAADEAGSAVGALAAAGTVNAPGNPVHWTRLAGVPAGLADGVDHGLTAVSTGAGLTGSGTAASPLAVAGVGAAELSSDAASLARVSANAMNTASGNVGVGGTPDRKLDVHGNARVRGTLTVDGAITATGGMSGQCGLVSLYGNNTCYRADTNFAAAFGYSHCMAISGWGDTSRGGAFSNSPTCAANAFSHASSASGWWCLNYALQSSSGVCYSDTYYIKGHVTLVCCKS
jgi:hypothetical protein